MSYNVWLEVDFQNVNKFVQLGQNYSITYNLREMFRATVGSTPSEWDGMIASVLLPQLTVGINRLIFHPDDYRKYESDNGWGTVSGCRDFLIKVQALCKEYPYATVRED
ncbi:hypothetical protein [Lactiplantibacillus pentosus]